MAAATAMKAQDEKMISLGLSKMFTNKEQVCCYSRALGSASNDNPILMLLHGYPQSAYMWRHMIPLLPPHAPIFVPDLPGYGASRHIEKNDKLSVGLTVFAALDTEIKRTSSSTHSTNVPVVLIGHDRGGRVAHRLAVTGANGVDVLGACFIDIVPTRTQWSSSTNSVQQAKEVTGYFHWPLLANVLLATRMIRAFGPANWSTEMIQRWAGSNSAGFSSLTADNALEVYGGFFEQEHTLIASNEDYKAGASTDIEAQEEDQKKGAKLVCPVLLLYSEQYIGKRYSFLEVWQDWVGEGVAITSHGLGDGVGHFGVEEAPKESATAINSWLERLR